MQIIYNQIIHFFNIALANASVVRLTTRWGAIEKKKHKPIYKSNTKNEVKRLRVTITKLEEQ